MSEYREQEQSRIAVQNGHDKNSFYTLLNSDQYKNNKTGLSVPFGTTTDGIFIYDVRKIPHLLVSGSTGTGKTSFIQTIIAELMLEFSPEDVKFLVYDSKAIDYRYIEKNPFFIIPPTSNPETIHSELINIVNEMNSRMQKLSYDRTYSIDNDIFVILDDCSEISQYDWIAETLKSILLNGRVTNIHIVLVTSTPSSKIIATGIRERIPCRIAFNVASKSVSRIVIDNAEAELLTVPGEMIFKAPNVFDKIQATYANDSELKEVIKKVLQDYNVLLNSLGDEAANIFGFSNDTTSTYTYDDTDPLFDEVVEYVVEAQKASTSLLQRRFGIGYNRAARFIDVLEDKGIIGPANGAKPREVYKKSTTTDVTYDDEPDIPLTTQPEIEGISIKTEVRDNKLVISKHLTGIVNAEAHLYGRTIKGLRYHKASFLRNGYIVIMIEPGSKLDLKKEPISALERMYMPQVLKAFKNELDIGKFKIEYKSSDDAKFRYFVKRLSRDTGIELIEE